MRAHSHRPFYPCDSRRVSLWYLSAGLRYTTQAGGTRPSVRMRPLVHDDEEPDASHPLHFPVEATALVFLAAATGTRRIAAYRLPLSPIRGQPQGRILLIVFVFVVLVFVVFLIVLVFVLEIGERMRNIVSNPAHVPQQKGEDRSQSHEGGDQGSLEGRDGKQETQQPPDQQHGGGECEYDHHHKEH